MDSNGEGVNMSGSLSNRGCYINKFGRALLPCMVNEATHFFCLDCAKKHSVRAEYKVVESFREKTKIVRTLCFKCFIKRAV